MNLAINQRASGLAVDAEFADDVLAGLGAPRKQLACRWFYDARGSELFEAITDLPEYYPTRTEMRILADHAPAMTAGVPPHAVLVEYGSGSSRKTAYMLDALDRLAAYAPIDVSEAALGDAVKRLATDRPELRVLPVVGDFLSDLHLPKDLLAAPRVGFFPGSTIGNFAPADAENLLRGVARQLGRGAHLILGVDLPKDRARLEAAYDDAAGVTAAFNLNLLARINRELGADFDLAKFRHKAVWNAQESRIEMHLVSTREQRVRLLGQSFHFARGETIHTENSYKYAIDRFAALARDAGFSVAQSWTDADRLFSVHTLVAN